MRQECHIPKRHRGHQSAGKPRRLIASSPKIPHSSQCTLLHVSVRSRHSGFGLPNHAHAAKLQIRDRLVELFDFSRRIDRQVKPSYAIVETREDFEPFLISALKWR
jgi:hypothetical protein